MVETDQAQQVKLWHIDELRRLKFTPAQRTILLRLIDDGELELAEIRSLVEDRGWTPEQAFLSVA